ncbi:class I SAM-dependent DNA methyltransferase [Bacillus sp. JJ1764]|uniref:class I SAM-dependent DNA methyltransferase n=1 Tax=Bacillus sp. JJ1764 TaxID=3122964 RepID=UPI002FFFA206
MSYEHFAYLYDELMRDAPYDDWVQYVKSKMLKYGIKGNRMLDLACGTGELSVRFAKEGFQVTGIDLSEDMLAVAQMKAAEAGLQIPFYQQNMAALEGVGNTDIIGIFCDSLNYLETEEEIKSTLDHAHRALNDGGLLIFDVHSIYKVSEVFVNQTFAINEDEISYIWNSFPGEGSNSVEHELSFFVLDEKSGKYDRYDELHFQRTYPVEHYSSWLAESGFKLLEINADFEEQPPQNNSERVFFVAMKN